MPRSKKSNRRARQPTPASGTPDRAAEAPATAATVGDDRPAPADASREAAGGAPAFRSYFDLLEAKYPDPDRPPPKVVAERAAATAPAASGTGVQRPLLAPVRRRREGRFWVIAAFLLVLGGIASSVYLSSPAADWPEPDRQPAAAPTPAEPAAPAPGAADTGPETGGAQAPAPTPAVTSRPAPPTPQRPPPTREPAGRPTPRPSADAPPADAADPASAAGQPEPTPATLVAETAPDADLEAPAEPTPPPQPTQTQSVDVPRNEPATPGPPTPADDPRPTEIQPVVAPGELAELVPARKVFAPQPTYPPAARRAGEQGTVILAGTVARDGSVTDARVLRGRSAALDRAALEAFRTWQFVPATRGGEPVEFVYRVGIDFTIEGRQVADALPFGGDFTPPTRLATPLPSLPQAAWAAGVSGDVVLMLRVDEAGDVTDVRVIEGLPEGTTERAVEAVRQWKFKPAMKDDQPVAVYHRVALRFSR